MTHDNVEVGRMIAREVTAVQPTGNYAIIKGQQGQTNPEFLRVGHAGDPRSPSSTRATSSSLTAPSIYTDDWDADNCPDQHGADPDRQQR